MTKKSRILLLSALLLPLVAMASDKAKEQRWANQIVDALIDGDPVWLKDPEGEFLGLFTEADDSNKAVIIMHGTGIHPNWPTVIYPLRTGLIDKGWTTLSIQMPVLSNEAKTIEYAPLYDDVPARIDAAVDYLKDNGIEHIGLIAHSLGASMVAYDQSKNQRDGVFGFIGIGMAAGGADKRMDDAYSIERIHTPMLDLYGEKDLPWVMKTRNERQQAAIKSGNKAYSQQQIPEAGHFYEGYEDPLIEVVADWLNAQIKP